MATESFKRDFVIDRKSEKCIIDLFKKDKKKVITQTKTFKQATANDIKHIFK